MDTATYELITGIGTLLLIALTVYRLLNPFRCVCGCWTWRAHKMLHHIEAKHVHVHGGE